ncbi:MAG: DUF192 domain-containing protein [Treponema sp.]|jgi:uncharacterized membrane protein (UPF0127 family)|nr:DUF192 domain-containing protein [Treponema sp.]
MTFKGSSVPAGLVSRCAGTGGAAKAGRIRFFFIFLCGRVLAGCESSLETREFLIARTGLEPVAIQAELALTGTQRTQGLMNRRNLDDGSGMLFVFDRDQILSFWMKDTLIPLSIAFIASDGRILEIRDMEPLDLTTVRSSRSARYALEVPRGWFDRAGVRAGDVIGIDETVRPVKE